jgi:cyclopropane fatty-acyl-phospholipid synthase-like methyltransferase
VNATLPGRLNNLWWERRLGVSTRGVVPIDHPDSVHYATMGYSAVRTVLRHLQLQPSDVFVDIGSGKGRVLCCAALSPIRQVVGVDLSEPLCREARANAASMRGRRAPITVENTLADQYDYSAATVLFLFDPFGPDTLRPVLKKIAEDTRGHGLRIAYANPSNDEVFQEQSWLHSRELWARADTGLEHDVTFYRS